MKSLKDIKKSTPWLKKMITSEDDFKAQFVSQFLILGDTYVDNFGKEYIYLGITRKESYIDTGRVWGNLFTFLDRNNIKQTYSPGETLMVFRKCLLDKFLE